MKESLLFACKNGDGTRSVYLLPVISGGITRPHFGLRMQSTDDNSTKKISLNLIPLNDISTKGAKSLTKSPIAGCLGLLRKDGVDFVSVILKCTLVADLGADRRIYRIDQVAFYAIIDDTFDASTDEESLAISSTGSPPTQLTNPTSDLANYLSSGNFYFSYSHDLTQSVQRESNDTLHSWRSCSRTFFWNAFLLDPVREFAEGLPVDQLEFIEHGGLFLVAMQGFVQSATVPQSTLNTNRMDIAVVSRLSCHRAGTRFLSRGIDDDGHVSNHVESEVLVVSTSGDHSRKHVFSYLITRGSVPVFWDQQGLQFGRPTFQITRSAAATQPAFDRHFDMMIRRYGMVHCLDLLSQKESSPEVLLSSAFKHHAEQYPGYPDTVTLSQFDVNAVCKNEDLERVGLIMPLISRDLTAFGYYLASSDADFVSDGAVMSKSDDNIDSTTINSNNTNSTIRQQRGVFRVNCQDCLDRTNMVQGFILQTIIECYLRMDGVDCPVVKALLVFNELWANNGDALSMIYTGTGALRSGFTRSGRRTIAGLMDDVRKTAQRFYVNNFQDGKRQVSVDFLLGKVDQQERVLIDNPRALNLSVKMADHVDEYSTFSTITCLFTTWNANGCPCRMEEDALLELVSSLGEEYDILVITFQEIVELSATQIMSVDPEARLQWEAYIASSLDHDAQKRYSFLVSSQLVGTSIIVFTKNDLIPRVKKVEIASVKTGFGGMTGNKGTVAVRMDIDDTSCCFLGSHFTAGQAYKEDRDREYRYILDSLLFTRQRSILSHDVIIWGGDFNYRVDLSIDQALDLVYGKQYERLLEYDQLLKSIKEKRAFNGFLEPAIDFPPTYKLNLYSDTYDVSEKQRVPSYCDRILYRGSSVVSTCPQPEYPQPDSAQSDYTQSDYQQPDSAQSDCTTTIHPLWYGRCAGVDFSDHRPVKALFAIRVCKIDRVEYERVQARLAASHGEYVGGDYDGGDAGYSGSDAIQCDTGDFVRQMSDLNIQFGDAVNVKEKPDAKPALPARPLSNDAVYMNNDNDKDNQKVKKLINKFNN